jgi:hypothetical protein
MEAFGVIPPPSNAARVRVTSIVDVPDIAPERAQHLARLLSSARMGAEAQPDPMNIDVAHDPALRQAKVILTGSPTDVAAMLRMISLFLEQGR